MRLSARGTQRLTYRLRLALEPEGLKNPISHRQRRSQEMERTRSETLKLFVAVEPNTQNPTPKGAPFYIASDYRTSLTMLALSNSF
jgi:hypothetical protein